MTRRGRDLLVPVVWLSSGAALALAGCLLWPEWESHRKRRQFETLVGELPHNMRSDDLALYVPPGYATFDTIGFWDENGHEKTAHLVAYEAKPALYVLFFTNDADAEFTSSVKLYLLGPAPPTYAPRSKWGSLSSDRPGDPMGYVGDFFSFLLGHEIPASSFRYKLIHSEPPADRTRYVALVRFTVFLLVIATVAAFCILLAWMGPRKLTVRQSAIAGATICGIVAGLVGSTPTGAVIGAAFGMIAGSVAWLLDRLSTPQ